MCVGTLTHSKRILYACECVHVSPTRSSWIHPLPLVCLCAVHAVGMYSLCVSVCVSLVLWNQLSVLSWDVGGLGGHQRWRLAWAFMVRRSGCWEIPSQAWACLFIVKWQPPVARRAQRDNSEKRVHLNLQSGNILQPSSFLQFFLAISIISIMVIILSFPSPSTFLPLITKSVLQSWSF